MKTDIHKSLNCAIALVIYIALCIFIEVGAVRSALPTEASRYIARKGALERISHLSLFTAGLYDVASSAVMTYKFADENGDIFDFFFDFKDRIIERNEGSYDI